MPHHRAGRGSRPPPASGLSAALAEWRHARYRDIDYTLTLAIDGDGRRARGGVRIELRLDRPVDLVLDWGGARLRALEVNGRPARARRVRSQWHIDASHARRGVNRIEAAFDADAGGALQRHRDAADGAVYVHTLAVPHDAHTLFPCFDQPDLRARFTLVLETPAGWRAIGNMPLAGEASRNAAVRAGRRLHHFATSPPLPAYLFAFAAGPFRAIREKGTHAAPGPVTLWARRSVAARARRAAPEVLDLNRRALGWYARELRQPFPFPKYDLVLLPDFAYGGMEHAGATFLREQAVLASAGGEARARRLHRNRRAQLVLHETAHQWCGDLVTLGRFTDLWIKEGLANLLACDAAIALRHADLSPEEARAGLQAVMLAAVRADLGPGAMPLVPAPGSPLAAPAQAKAVYGPGVYGKGPAALAALRRLIGRKAFRRALREFLARHAWGAAGTADLLRAFAASLSGPGRARPRQRLRDWADAWLYRTGLPAPACNPDERNAPRYARFVPDDATARQSLAAPRALAREPRALDRLRADAALWETVREGRLDPARWLDRARARIETEPDGTVAAVLREQLAIALRRYLVTGNEAARGTASSGAHAGIGRLSPARAIEALTRPSLPDTTCLDRAAALPARERLRLMRAALAALPRLFEQRRIFFTEAWLARFVSAQTGPGALDIARSFLRPGALPAPLRLKLRAAVDELRRTLRIRRRWPGRMRP